MTSATTIKEEPVISVDKSRTYEINAGKCEHCGNFKTWDYRVQNQKSGKMMPGHVTEEGFKINDGDCPYWAAMRAKRKINGAKNQTTVQQVKLSVKNNSRTANSLHWKIIPQDEDTAIVEIDGKKWKVSKDDAKDLIFDLVSAYK
ncbi:MAG: hypothetical protein ACFFCS_12205 [Candidatus Hodarchaeota archaeon]